MAKYSFEFKKKVVLAYLNGEDGYSHLSKLSEFLLRAEQHNHQFTGGHGCRPIIVRTDGLRQ